jgi:hypothetical protein
MNLCDYGCGKEARYQFKNGKWCCSKNHKSCFGMKYKGIPDPRTNPANFKKCCKYCNELFASSVLQRHEEKCYLNPENIRLCPKCNKPVKRGNIFCSSRCAALVTTPGRKHTELTKKKISISNGGDGTRENKCKICGNKTGNITRQYCSICRPKPIFPIKAQEMGSLTFVQYEEKLSYILSEIYGQLRKEKINGVYPDFCNRFVIIDFTFDSTKGTQDLIKRFKKIKNDSRKKIAFIPNKDVGEIRKNKLLKLGVKIENSDPYRFLL